MKRFAVLVLIGFLGLINAQAQSTKVLIKTTMGDITVMLYDDTPLHKDNFIDLVKSKFYDGLLFHRVMNEFMIQAGDPNSKDAKPGALLGNGNPGYTIPPEFRRNHYHKKGALAAARLGDKSNPRKESSGSQFYIVQGKKFKAEELDQIEKGTRPAFTDEERKIYTTQGGTPWLDFNYTVFGEVISGIEVIDAIAAVKCDKHNRPIKDIKILSAKIISQNP